MSTAHLLLGLLANGPKHGYELKHAHDRWLPRARPLAYGQVYATLGRLHRDGLVEPVGQDRAGGPDRTSYALTSDGRDSLDGWISTVESPAPYVASTLLAKVVVALLVADPHHAHAYLAAQRQAHLARLRELTAVKADSSAVLSDVIAADFAITHVDADLRWLESTIRRVAGWHGKARS